MHTVRYFDGRTYHWVSLSQQPNIINKVCLQHLPSHYVVNENISVQLQPFFGLIWFLGWIIQGKRFDWTIFLVITLKNYTYWVLLWWSKSFIMGPPKIILEFSQIFQHYGNWSVIVYTMKTLFHILSWVYMWNKHSILILGKQVRNRESGGVTLSWFHYFLKDVKFTLPCSRSLYTSVICVLCQCPLLVSESHQ